jgi:isopentenyl diphosphate isomerase/L-lactate dehydrogenase-like FMN-dependent dehydrogenase
MVAQACSSRQVLARRRLLKFLLASPLVAPLARLGASQQAEELIAAPEQALNVFDFEAVARRKLPPAHFGYLQTGVDDDATLRANREGFRKFSLRVRRLVDVSQVDTSVELFGAKWDTPVVIAPCGSQKAFHPQGELAVARAARAKNHLQILSTVGSTAVEEVNEARGAPVWFQLYPTDDWAVARALVKRAEAAGCPVLVLTVDLQGGTNRETGERAARRDPRKCSACHHGDVFTSVRAYVARKPMFRGLDVSRVDTLGPMDMTWDYLKRLRDATPMPLVIKGIVTREDAELAIEHGASGIIVSNHGGRGEESGRATVDCLPDVVEAAQGRVPVLVDGGFRRGTDVFKALALGASAVAVGRPYLWGLAAFGQPGVEAVLEILRRELQTIMRQAGTTRLAAINRSYLAPL